MQLLQQGDNVRVKRQGWYFTQVANQALKDNRLRTIDKMVYVALSYFADIRDGGSYPSYAKIGEIASCSKRSAISSVQKLETLGYIRRELRQTEAGRQTSNLFTIMEAAEDPHGEGAGDSPSRVQEIHGEGEDNAPEQELKNKSQRTREYSDPIGPGLPTEIDPVVDKLPQQKDRIAAEWERNLTAHTPPGAWRSISMERGMAKRLATATKQLGIGPDDKNMPAIIEKMVQKYMELKTHAKSDYWRTAPVTPSGVYTRWGQIVDAMIADRDQPAGGNMEVDW